MRDHGTTNHHPVYPKRHTEHLRVGNNSVSLRHQPSLQFPQYALSQTYPIAPVLPKICQRKSKSTFAHSISIDPIIIISRCERNQTKPNPPKKGKKNKTKSVNSPFPITHQNLLSSPNPPLPLPPLFILRNHKNPHSPLPLPPTDSLRRRHLNKTIPKFRIRPLSNASKIIRAASLIPHASSINTQFQVAIEI